MLKRHVFVPAIWILVLVLWALPALAEMIVDTAWVGRYNGPANSVDIARAIAKDDSGNVYVTGESPGSGTSWDYATIKYYPNGDTAWVRRYNGPASSEDEAKAIAVDDSGRVYVTGHSFGSGTYEDYATIKYHPNGDTVWLRRYDGPQYFDTDKARDIAADDSGYVYVSGWSGEADNNYATIKYYPNGNTAWVRRYDSGSNDWVHDMVVDSSGNVDVTGKSGGDYATIKYYPNGDTAWLRRYNGPGGGIDDAKAIAADDSGNVYVTGYSRGAETGWDFATIKYYPDGDTAWVRRYNGTEGDNGYAIALDESGNVYVTGDSWNGTDPDYATIKYYPEGDTAWVRRYNGPAASEDSARAIAVDTCGNIYVTGWSVGDGTGYDYATVKYDSSGNELWVERYNGPGNGDERAHAILVNGCDEVYVTGESKGIGTSRDYATIKYVQSLRGDCNADGIIDIGDVVYLINYLFTGTSAPDPLSVGDCNCDEVVDIGDVIYLINYLFTGTSPPDC